MISETSIQKAIWRRPGETGIYYITEGGGDDEFIVAPFLKDASSAVIRGSIHLADRPSIDAFFNDIHLTELADPLSTSRNQYITAVKHAIESIVAGRFEKVVLARRLFTEQPPQLQQVFEKLEQQYPGAFVYCFVLHNGTCMTGATPETLLMRKNGVLTTEALGGTSRAKGYSEKEYLEHRHIITDISNKLKAHNYSFSTGDTLPRQAGNIAHLATPFSMQSISAENDLALLQILHPTAAVGGLPFEPALQFILQEEDFSRNYYSGYLGIRKGDDFSFYVNLRCAEVYKNGAMLFAGAGINRDSDPEDEWVETGEKINTLLSQLA